MMRFLSGRTIATAALATLACTSPAFAGPPLVCHPFDIGTAASLPWNATGDNWRGARADYDVSHLTADTLAALTPGRPVIVRMETLRRAAIYATSDAGAARSLLDALLARARTHGDARTAIAQFDAGYLVETYKQLAPISAATATLAADIDGYRMVKDSLSMTHGDPSIAFAAALMTSGKTREGDHEGHVRNAKAGAAGDQLLARNINWLGQ
jgi:hypothetical protein